jgi:O-antigen ligase
LANLTTFALCSFAFFAMTVGPIGKYSLRFVALGGFVIWFFYGGQLKKSGSTVLLIAAIVLPLVSWGFAHVNHPFWAESSPKIHRLTNWFLFIPIAVILGGRTKNIYIFWFLSLIGILCTPWLTGLGWQDFELGMQGIRRDFGLHNAQHAALLYGVFLLGLLVFTKRFFSVKGPYRWLLIPLWFLSFVTCTVAVVITQTRGIWFGLIMSFLLCIPVVLFRRDKIRLNNRNWLVVVIVIAVFALSLFSLIKSSNIIQERITDDLDSVENILEMDLHSLDSGSIGIRIKIWQASWPWIKEHPLVGWGGNAPGLVVDESGLGVKFGHLHNSYVDILVSYGVLGIVLFFSLVGWMLYMAVKAWHSGFLPGDVLLFFYLYLGFWLFVNCFESYMFFSSGIYVFNLVSGGIVTLIWRYQLTPLKS